MDFKNPARNENREAGKETFELNTPNLKIPDRYRIKNTIDGTVLTCIEAPNITVKIQRDFSVSLQEAKKFPERSIFLDGAARGEPFLDNARQIYNLDHHEGCERTFTLATCEQALILVRKGLNLREKNWVIYANEPDLDTVFAIWILLNHNYLRDGNSKQYRKIIPLIRLEGVIDALGFELTDITAIPFPVIKNLRSELVRLQEWEIKLKKENRWQSIDYVFYTHRILNLIDQLAFDVQDVKEFKNVMEIARADINDEDYVVVFEGDLGIYELEEYLSQIYYQKPTFLILKKGHNTYTIRKTNLFSPLSLEKVYERLNIFDKNVSGKDRENRWGGSNQIGGSPRVKGTALSPHEIVQVVKKTFTPVSPWEFVKMFGFALFFAFMPNVISWVLMILGIFVREFSHLLVYPVSIKMDVFYYFFVIMLFLWAFLFFPKYMHVFGIRYPVLKNWSYGLVPALVALFGGVWLPREYELQVSIYNFLISFVIGPALASLLFFGVIHGLFLFSYPVQRFDGEYFLSIPALLTSLFYTLVTVSLPFYQSIFPTAYHDIPSFIDSTILMPIHFLYGVAMSFFRERVESVIPAVILHVAVHVLWGLYITFL